MIYSHCMHRTLPVNIHSLTGTIIMKVMGTGCMHAVDYTHAGNLIPRRSRVNMHFLYTSLYMSCTYFLMIGEGKCTGIVALSLVCLGNITFL